MQQIVEYPNVVRAYACEESLRKAVAAIDYRVKQETNLWNTYSLIWQHVQQYRQISINIQVQNVQNLLDARQVKNLHQILKENESLLDNNPSYLKQIEERRYVAALLGFSDIEEDLIYGALNTGNAGCRRYGPFCFILDNEFVRSRVSFTKQNSYRYANKNFMQVDFHTSQSFNAKTDLAVWHNVRDLAALKFGEHILTGQLRFVPESMAPEIINGLIVEYDDCIEAQIYGPVPLDKVTEIRVPETLILRRLQIKDKISRGNDLHQKEALWRSQYEPIFERLESEGFLLIPV